MILWF